MLLDRLLIENEVRWSGLGRRSKLVADCACADDLGSLAVKEEEVLT